MGLVIEWVLYFTQVNAKELWGEVDEGKSLVLCIFVLQVDVKFCPMEFYSILKFEFSFFRINVFSINFWSLVS